MNLKQPAILPMIAAGLAAFSVGCASPAVTPPAAVTASPTTTAVTPVNLPEGRVVVVNPDHQFVVLDFGAYPIPRIGTEIGLYRGTERIGQLRLTEPRRGRLISADILEGKPQTGDLAR